MPILQKIGELDSLAFHPFLRLDFSGTLLAESTRYSHRAKNLAFSQPFCYHPRLPNPLPSRILRKKNILATQKWFWESHRGPIILTSCDPHSHFGFSTNTHRDLLKLHFYKPYLTLQRP